MAAIIRGVSIWAHGTVGMGGLYVCHEFALGSVGHRERLEILKPGRDAG